LFKILPKQTGDSKEAERILKEENIGRLGVTAGNYPYVVPLCYLYHREAVYFHSNKKGLKLEKYSKKQPGLLSGRPGFRSKGFKLSL